MDVVAFSVPLLGDPRGFAMEPEPDSEPEIIEVDIPWRVYLGATPRC